MNTTVVLENTDTTSRIRGKHIALAMLALVLLLTFALRFHLRNIPLERDEGEYAYAGQLILQGIPPYKLAYNMKLPGTYAAYAIIMALFGQTIAGIHLGVAVVVLATMILVSILGWRFGGPIAAVVSAASYGLLSASASVLGFCGHATHFVVLAAIAGLLVLLKAIEQDRKSLFFWSGFLLGIGILMKQPGFIFVLFGGLYFLRLEARRGINWPKLGGTLGLYSVGSVLPFLITCFLMWQAGVFSRFWFWTVSYAAQYATNYGLTVGAFFFYLTAPPIVWASIGIWLIAAVGIIMVGLDRNAKQRSEFLLGLFLFSFLALCPDLAFRKHYFILMLPIISVLAGAAVSIATTRLSMATTWRSLRYVPGVLFTLALAASFYQQRDFFLETNPLAAVRSIYYQDPFPEALPISAYIRQHTPENARIAVLGSEPEIYFYSHRHSATGYIYTYGLMEDQKYAVTMQEQMISEIEAARPEVLVFVNLYGSWSPGPHSQNLIYTWARKYIQDHYEIIGVVNVPINQFNYRWGAAAKNFRARPYSAVLIFNRKGSEPTTSATPSLRANPSS